MTNDDEDTYDLISLHVAEPKFGVQVGHSVLRTHPASVCADDPACCIHKPSGHPLNKAALNWRADRGLMERICAHGVAHPDPDDLAHKRRVLGQERYDMGSWAIHNCDGCCYG